MSTPSLFCRHCGKQLPPDALFCDKCGTPTGAAAPVEPKAAPEKSPSLAGGILALILVGGGAWALFSPSKPTPPPKSDAECQRDVQCWSERHGAKSLRPCTQAVERMAAHSFRWVDGTMEAKFPRVSLNDDEHKTIRYVGDLIEFQNGFGAFTRYTYVCTWDPVTEQATSVGWAGRLPSN